MPGGQFLERAVIGTVLGIDALNADPQAYPPHLVQG